MGLEALTERLLALANRPDDDHDCEWIHKGVTTRPARILAKSAFLNVGHRPHAVVVPRPSLPLPFSTIRTSPTTHRLERVMSDEGTPKVGFYVCHCGTNIAGTVNVDQVSDYVAGLPGVSVSRNYQFMCSEPGQDLIEQDIREQGLDRVVVAACSPMMHELTFRGAVGRTGLNPYLFQMVNVREHCAWIHSDPAASHQQGDSPLQRGD